MRESRKKNMENAREREKKKKKRRTSCKITNFISPMIHRAFESSNVPENPRFSSGSPRQLQTVTRANKLKRYERHFFTRVDAETDRSRLERKSQSFQFHEEKVWSFLLLLSLSRFYDSFRRTRNVAKRGLFRNESLFVR